MLSMDELMALVGEPLDGPVVQAFLAAHSPSREKLADRYQMERAFSSKEQGYEVQYKKARKGRPARVETVFLFLAPKDGFSPFGGPLSEGLSPTDGREDVHRRLGPPTRSGAADEEGEWLWDRFDSETRCLHLAYGPWGKGLRMITLMAPGTAP